MPRKTYRKEDKIAILKKFLQYIEESEQPIIEEFCYQNNIYDTQLRRWSEDKSVVVKDDKANIYDFKFALKKALYKDILYCRQQGKKPGGTSSFYIFTLKNIAGWRDMPNQEPTTTTVNVNVDKVLQSQPEQLEHGVQDMLQSVKIDNNRKRKSPSSKN